MQWLVDPGGTATIRDRSLVVHSASGIGHESAGLIGVVREGPFIETVSSSMEDIPDMSDSITTTATGNLAITFSAEGFTSASGTRMLVRALVDGKPTDPSNVVFANGTDHRSQSFTFLSENVPAGVHEVRMQWLVAPGGTATMRDRSLVVHATHSPFQKLGDLGAGIAAQDETEGQGFIMFSGENIHSRFSDFPPHERNSDHLIAVKYFDGQWHYDDRNVYHTFSPHSNDLLVAEIDFTSDRVTILQGASGVQHGINLGYVLGDLQITANAFDGEANPGDFSASGTQLLRHSNHVEPVFLSLENLKRGIAASDDNARGRGFILYSAENVHSRFQSPRPHPDNSDHMIIVRYFAGQWHYDNGQNRNLGIGGFHAFVPRSGDFLIAEVDFTEDVVVPIRTIGELHGIRRGFILGDVTFRANEFGGTRDVGEFSVDGSLLLSSVNECRVSSSGDFNNNGVVEQADLDLALLNWGLASDRLPAEWSDGRPSLGIVDQEELDAVLLNWGKVTGSVVAARVEPFVTAPLGTADKRPLFAATNSANPLAEKVRSVGREQSREGVAQIEIL
jgi:hypothetical protein